MCRRVWVTFSAKQQLVHRAAEPLRLFLRRRTHGILNFESTIKVVEHIILAKYANRGINAIRRASGTN